VVSGICLDDANLHRTDFPGALLVNASFDHADLRNTNFESADLRNAKITYLRTPEHVFEEDPVQQRDQATTTSGMLTQHPPSTQLMIIPGVTEPCNRTSSK
jgi:hypothetical protein